ncbi:glycoside hydrolase family 16 protein, partial [Saccharata proteae CBS 121410]
ALAVLFAVSVVHASSIPTCGPGNLCPESAPCCSQYGQCGVGGFCVNGCDPIYSHALDSCVPASVCNSNDYTINGLDGIVAIDDYLGDASTGNWVATGNPLAYKNNQVLLTMAESTVGTLLASTHYVWYGKISAKLRTSQGAGVVTAFIMMSDVRDEIDFEFVGVDTAHAQSNYYSQGVTNYNNGDELATSDTVSNEHEYTIDWQPDTLTWSIDGNVMRTLKRADTWNATVNRFDYPQTPSRVMLSLWPAGLSSNGEGTISWAGGLVDWNSPYMQNGYYYASVSSVTVECYEPPSGANVTGSKSYVYNDYDGTNTTVAIVDEEVILASFYATGENPDTDPNAKSSASSSEVETIPGMSGVGNRGDNGAQASGAANSGNSDSSSSGSSDSSGGQSSGLSSGSSTFSQGNAGSSGGSSGASGLTNGRDVVGGSIFAVCVAVVGLLVL